MTCHVWRPGLPTIGVMIVAALVSAGEGLAQAQETRPFQAAFSGASREPNRKQSFGIGFLLEQARGESGSTDQGIGTTGAVNGAFSTFGTYSRFDWRGRNVEFGASGSTSLRYYARTGEFLSENHSTSAGLSAQFDRTSLFVNQSLTYTPAYLAGLAATFTRQSPGTTAMPGADVLLDTGRAFVHTTDFNLSRRVGRRGTAAIMSTLEITDFRGAANALRGLTTYDIGGSYRHGLSRDVGLVLGYAYEQAQYADGTKPVEHRIDTGLDYHKRLSFSRNTTLSSSVGSAILSGEGELHTRPVGQELGARQFQLRAAGQVSHQLGRTWRLDGVYRREVGYVEELGAPVLTGAWTAAANGFVNRSVDVSASVSYTSGANAYLSTEAFSTYTGSAQARVAVAKSWALTFSYYLYAHDFTRGALTPGVPLNVRESVFRIGLTRWFPLKTR